jgi:transcription elongation factor GreA
MLRQRVAELQLMNLDRIPHGKAGFGSKITVSENGKTSIYELVMPEDANPESGLISLASPLGRAFANKEEGDEVVVATPSGEREFAIISLTTIHEE